MNRVQRTALLAFFLLILMAAAGWWLGGKKAQPADAEPEAILLDPGGLETVRLLPPEKRKRYVDPNRFYAPPVPDPLSGESGRTAGGHVDRVDPVGSDTPVGGGRASEASYRVVRVHQGETLSHIAKRELGDAGQWRKILNWNAIESEQAVYHVVAKGEILGRISQIHYGTTKGVDRILAANGVTDPNKIKVGQKLLIPPYEGE